MSKLASIELRLKGHACTEKALAFDDPEDLFGTPIWIPRSQIRNLDSVLDGLPERELFTLKEKVTLHLSIWFLEQKGLDAYAEELEEELMQQ